MTTNQRPARGFAPLTLMAPIYLIRFDPVEPIGEDGLRKATLGMAKASWGSRRTDIGWEHRQLPLVRHRLYGATPLSLTESGAFCAMKSLSGSRMSSAHQDSEWGCVHPYHAGW